MPAKIKYFIRVSKKSVSNDANIRLRFYNGTKFDITAVTPFQVRPDLWSNKTGTYSQRAELKNRNEKVKALEDLAKFIKDEYFEKPEQIKITKEWLKEKIDIHCNPDYCFQDNRTLFGYIQNFINNSEKRINPETGNPVCYKMRREYQVTFNYLKKYAKKYGEPDFIDIDLEFYQQFVEFLRNYEEKDLDGTIIKSGLAVNTIGKKIQTLKIFLNDATEQGINKYQKYKSRKFKALAEESDNIYLTKDELKQFYEFDFSKQPYLERVRDLFIVASWTGVRYSDLQQISPDKIQGDFIHLKQKKTGGKVVIPVYNVVKEILKKYNGKLPKTISNQKYNDYLKKAAEIAEINTVFIKTVSVNGLVVEKKYPKYDLISSHTARRSFCTNAYKDNIPTLSIMAISGHKTEKAFLKYIKVDGEEHARKVMQIWQNQGNHLSIAN
ncbi:MAG: site-specific integrase [Bacteroidales bacterium]|nr:site-specific integrase [Bacteroidales bacterium]